MIRWISIRGPRYTRPFMILMNPACEVCPFNLLHGLHAALILLLWSVPPFFLAKT